MPGSEMSVHFTDKQLTNLGWRLLIDEERGSGRRQFAQGRGTDPSPAAGSGSQSSWPPTSPPSHAPDTNPELAAAPRLPPGPGLSAQGWGAKPREGERRGQEGERRSKRKESRVGRFKTSAGSRTSFDRGSVPNYMKYFTTRIEYNLHVVTGLGWLQFAGCKRYGFVGI